VVLDATSIGPWISDDYVRLAADVGCGEARERITAAGADEGQVVSPEGRYLGVVALNRLDRELDAGRGDRLIGEVAQWPQVVLDTRTSIWDALGRAEAFNGHALPVLGPGRSQRLAGVVPEPALIRAYMATMRRIRDEEHATP